MNCQKCQSDRIIKITSKCSDCFIAESNTKDYDGYVPKDLGIGGGDYVKFSYCLNCGQIQNKFPLPTAEVEENSTTEDE